LNRVKALEQSEYGHSNEDSIPTDSGSILIPQRPGTPLQIFAEDINVDLDPKNFPFEGKYQNGYLIANENNSMLWVWYYIGEVNSNYQIVTFRNVSGSKGINNSIAPIAGCCTEWNPDPDDPYPKMGLGTKCFVYGTQRDKTSVRVIGGHNNIEPVHLAVGFMLPKK